MNSMESDGEGDLLYHIVKRLIGLQESDQLPTDAKQLQVALQPVCKALSVVQPLFLLDTVNVCRGEDVWLKVNTPCKRDVREMCPTVWEAGTNRAKRVNAKLMFADPNSDCGIEIVKNMKAAINQLSDPDAKDQQALRQKFMQATSLRVSLGPEEIERRIVSLLIEAGYIETLPRSSAGITLKYKWPPEVMLACLGEALKDYEKRVNQAFTNGLSLETDFRTIILEMNKALDNLTSFMEKKLKQRHLSTAADTYLKKQSDDFSLLEGSEGQGSRHGQPQPETEKGSTSATGDAELQFAQWQMRHIQLENRSCFDTWLGDMWKELHAISLEGLNKLSDKLTPEAAHVMLHLNKLDNHKPKTVKALCNALRPACSFLYVASPIHLREGTPVQLQHWCREKLLLSSCSLFQSKFRSRHGKTAVGTTEADDTPSGKRKKQHGRVTVQKTSHTNWQSLEGAYLMDDHSLIKDMPMKIWLQRSDDLKLPLIGASTKARNQCMEQMKTVLEKLQGQVPSVVDSNVMDVDQAAVDTEQPMQETGGERAFTRLDLFEMLAESSSVVTYVAVDKVIKSLQKAGLLTINRGVVSYMLTPEKVLLHQQASEKWLNSEAENVKSYIEAVINNSSGGSRKKQQLPSPWKKTRVE